MDTRKIAGLVVGVVATLSLFVVGVWFYYRRRQRSRNGFHLDDTNLEPHSMRFEHDIASSHDPESGPNHEPRRTQVDPPCELSSKLPDSQKSNRPPDDCKRDPEPHENHRSPCPSVAPSPERQHSDCAGDLNNLLPHINIAVFVLEPKQDYPSSLLADREDMLSPDRSCIFSLYFGCELMQLPRLHDLDEPRLHDSDEIPTLYAARQRHDEEIRIDGIIYNQGVDPKTLDSIESTAVPRIPIPNIPNLKQDLGDQEQDLDDQEQDLDDQEGSSGILLDVVEDILKVLQKAREENIRNSHPDKGRKRRSSFILGGGVKTCLSSPNASCGVDQLQGHTHLGSVL